MTELEAMADQGTLWAMVGFPQPPQKIFKVRGTLRKSGHWGQSGSADSWGGAQEARTLRGHSGNADTAERFRGAGTGGRCRGAGSGAGLQLIPLYTTSKAHKRLSPGFWWPAGLRWPRAADLRCPWVADLHWPCMHTHIYISQKYKQ